MRSRLLLILVLALVCDFAWGQGCSQCRLVTEQGTELGENSFGSSINYGILFLLVVPYLLIAFFFRKGIINFFRRILKLEKPAS